MRRTATAVLTSGPDHWRVDGDCRLASTDRRVVTVSLSIVLARAFTYQLHKRQRFKVP